VVRIIQVFDSIERTGIDKNKLIHFFFDSRS
jgi:hypothetical protein